MIDAEKPLDVHQSVPGTGPTEPLAGQGRIPSVLEVMMAQAEAMGEMAKTMGDMLHLNHQMMQQLLGEPDSDEPDPDAPYGYDMEGKRIKAS